MSLSMTDSHATRPFKMVRSRVLGKMIDVIDELKLYIPDEEQCTAK